MLLAVHLFSSCFIRVPQVKGQADPKTRDVCKYFSLRSFYCVSVNMYANEVCLFIVYFSLQIGAFGLLSAQGEEKMAGSWQSAHFCHTCRPWSWCHRLPDTNGSTHSPVLATLKHCCSFCLSLMSFTFGFRHVCFKIILFREKNRSKKHF